jgi:hypothetical protein
LTAPFVGRSARSSAYQRVRRHASTGSGGIGVSAGIAEALIETALGRSDSRGWFYNFLTSRIEYFNVEMTIRRRSSSITSSRRRHKRWIIVISEL